MWQLVKMSDVTSDPQRIHVIMFIVYFIFCKKKSTTESILHNNRQRCQVIQTAASTPASPNSDITPGISTRYEKIS